MVYLNLRPLHGLYFFSRQGKDLRKSGVYTLVYRFTAPHFELIFNAVLEEKTFVQRS